MLWDVPILFVAFFGKTLEDLAVLEKLLASPPAKFLGLGTDQLLIGYFRGEWVPPVFCQGRKNENKRSLQSREMSGSCLFLLETDGYQ